MKINNKLINKNALTATPSSNYTVQASDVRETIPLNQSLYKINNNLTIQNNKIVIGKGINYILVSGQIYWYQNVSGVETHGYIAKNNNNIIIRTSRHMEDNYEHLSFPATFIPVSEGDTIYMMVQVERATSPMPIISTANNSTFLTVVAI